MKCLLEIYGESAVATRDGKAKRRRRIEKEIILTENRVLGISNLNTC